MAIWLKKCANLGQTANGYMVELQVITDDICQWLGKFEAEAAAYLSGSTSEMSGKLLPPKTPTRQKLLRKRLLKTSNHEDIENSPPPRKSPCMPSNSTSSPETPVKKLSICLTRIDENNPISPQKAQTPAKPPRRLKLALESNQGTHSITPNLFEADAESPIVVLKERISNMTNMKKITSPLHRVSISRRRSSIARVIARQSIRRSKRISEKMRVTVTIPEIVDNNTSGIIEETVALANVAESSPKAGAAKSTDDISVKQTVMIKIESQEGRRSKNSTEIPAVKSDLDTSPNCLNSTRTISKENVSSNVSNGSIIDIESDVDSVISKTPSPVCPANKVVQPTKMRKLQTSAVRTALRTPISRTSVSAGPAGRSKKLKSKPSISGFHTKTNARNSSLTSNTGVFRLSPKPMTPQQKQDKCLEMIYLREQKSQEILRVRKETMKKAIEEKQRKRAEKLMKAKMQKEKLEEARLAKIREEEERMIQRKKMQEEAEKKRIAQEKQMEKEQEKERQKEQRQREIQEREKLQREAEQKTTVKVKEETMQNLLNSTVTIEKLPLNSTVIMDSTHNESNNYNMTPQPNYPLPNRNADNYDIDNLNEGDSTDDDEQPRQVIPRWAQGHEFKKAILQQLRAKINYVDIFPPGELMQAPNLQEIFKARKKKYDKRTSSAVWTSPVWKVT